MPIRLIPDSTIVKEIAGVTFEIRTPTNGQMFKVAQQVTAIKENAESADIDTLMQTLAPLIVSIDGSKCDIVRRLVRWDDFNGQIALMTTIMAMGNLSGAEEKNSGSSSAGNTSGQPPRELSNTEKSAEIAENVSASLN